MTKRLHKKFKRKARDFYPTPYEAVIPLLPHLKPGTRFCEPCAGDGALIDHLEKHGHECVAALDVEPKRDDIDKVDSLEIFPFFYPEVDCSITNPPWSRPVLHALIECLSFCKPTWLLFDADWMHTKQAAPYLKYCKKIVSVGRVKWIEGSKSVGFDNCAWYLFDQKQPESLPVFYGAEIL